MKVEYVISGQPGATELEVRVQGRTATESVPVEDLCVCLESIPLSDIADDISRLSLVDIPFVPETTPALLRVLQCLNNLTSLYMNSCELRCMESVRTLFESICRSETALHTIRLTDTYCKEDTLQIVCECVSRCSQVTHLSVLYMEGVSPQQVTRTLAQLFEHSSTIQSSLTRVGFCLSDLDTETFQLFVNSLLSLPQLRHLDLNCADLETSGLSCLAQLASLESLSFLNGSFTMYTENGFEFFASLVHLQSLNLHGVVLEGDEVEDVCRYLIASDCPLSDIHLGGSSLQSLSSCEALSALIRQKPLAALDISFTALPLDGIDAIASTLYLCPTITQIQMQQTIIETNEHSSQQTEEIWAHIGQCLADCPLLSSLDIRESMFCDSQSNQTSLFELIAPHILSSKSLRTLLSEESSIPVSNMLHKHARNDIVSLLLQGCVERASDTSVYRSFFHSSICEVYLLREIAKYLYPPLQSGEKR